MLQTLSMRSHSADRSRIWWLLLGLAIPALPLSAQDTTSYVITTSDGVQLEATLALPDSGAPVHGFPAVVLIHGYGGNKDEMVFFSNYLTTLGYGCLTYSVRGQGKSGGLSTTMGPRETQDLLEVVQYLRTLPGIDPDNLGVAGGSQGGIHAWIAATHNMPGVRAIASLVGPPSFSLDLFPHACIKQQLYFELNLGAVRYDPLRDRVRDFVVRDQYDSLLAFARSRDLEQLLDSVRIPVVQCTGWADVLFPVNGAIRTVDRLTSRGIPVWSYFGTNGHGEQIHLGEYIFELNFLTSWFDRWLKGIPLDHSSAPFIVYADDGPAWPHHESIGWPPPSHQTLRLYISGTRLQTTYPSQAQELPFTLAYNAAYTPAQGWSDAYLGTAFTNAFRSSPARMISDPLADTIEITGIPHAVLQLQSGASMFQSHLRIFDIAPVDTGLVWSLITRGAHGVRNNVPGTSLQREFDCQALSHVVPPGHRIGVEITSLDMYDASRAQIIPYFSSSTSTLKSSPTYPSYLDLPLVGGVRFVAVAPVASVHPSEMLLHQNYPNPFNPSTTIGFRVGGATAASRSTSIDNSPSTIDNRLGSGGLGLGSSWVKLSVYDILGREVAVLVEGSLAPGDYSAEFNGTRYASGMYVCRLTNGTQSVERKMVLVR